MTLSEQGKFTGSTLSLGEVTLRVGEKLSWKFRTQYGPDSAGETTEQHEVYEAIQIAKNAKPCLVHEAPDLSEVPAIMKVKTQLVGWSYKPDSFQCSEEIWNEIRNLKEVEKCGSTPKLLGYRIEQQGNGDIFPGGYIAYIGMRKLPGKNLEKFGEMEEKEQHQVRIAFLNALWDFCAHHFYHRDPRLQNLIWDRDLQKCYIVDLEDVEHDSASNPEDICLDPWEHLGYWGLIEEDPACDPELFFSKDAVIERYKAYEKQQEQYGKISLS